MTVTEILERMVAEHNHHSILNALAWEENDFHTASIERRTIYTLSKYILEINESIGDSYEEREWETDKDTIYYTYERA